MSYDYSKLRGAIIEKFGSQSAFARKIKLSERSLSNKLNGNVGWKQPEITRVCDILGISEDKIPQYFFALKVQNN